MKDSFNDLTYEELLNKREELKKNHMDKRFSKVLGHVESPIELRIVRRQIARLNTIIHEYSLGIRKS